MSAVAAVSPEWPHGKIDVCTSTPIGVGYGLSGGDVYRIEASSDNGRSVSFILKRESAEAVTRALEFHRAVGSRAAPAVPVCLGGYVDQDANEGVLLLEDIAPAEQGDVLRGCADLHALAAIRSLGRIHAASSGLSTEPPTRVEPRWQARAFEPGEWSLRLSAAAERFPAILTRELFHRLTGLPRKVEGAIASLRCGATVWIHTDAHLDNVLFRPDSSAVILDWSGAAIGPPAVDLARLLTEGVNAGAREELTNSLMTTYASEWKAGGAGERADGDLWEELSSSIALLGQTAIGWAAREEHREPQDRMRALQENLLRSFCAWATNSRMTEPGRLFA